MPPNPLTADLDHILAHTEGLWEELRGQRVFITGGTGFFGCWLLESFAWANTKLNLKAQAVVLSRDSQAFSCKAPHLFSNSAIMFQRGDVRDFQFPTGSFSHVIHAASETSGKLNAKNPLAILDTIVAGTRHTLDFAVASGAKKFLLTSSGAVYGKQPSGLTHISEEYGGSPDPADPASAYGECKRLAEMLCTLYHQQHGLEIKVARCFAFVGPYLPLDSQFAVSNFIRDALRGDVIQVNGDGTPYRSYLYAADLAIWLWTILFRGTPCRPYNVGSSEGHPIGEVAQQVADIIGNGRVQIARPSSNRPPLRYVPDVRRAGAELELQVWLDLSAGVQRTAVFQKGKC